MKFTPRSESDIEQEQKERMEANLWPKGSVCDFEVKDAEDTQSKAGNDMIKLTLQVFNDKGKSQFLFDYLLASMAYKLRHAAYACGIGSRYEAGDLSASDFIGKAGRLEIGVQAAKDGYGARNTVQDYVLSDSQFTAAQNAKTETQNLQDIPFNDSIEF